MHVLCWHMNVHVVERIQVCFEVVSTEKNILIRTTIPYQILQSFLTIANLSSYQPKRE
jgi:hypothetical protein